MYIALARFLPFVPIGLFCVFAGYAVHKYFRDRCKKAAIFRLPHTLLGVFLIGTLVATLHVGGKRQSPNMQKVNEPLSMDRIPEDQGIYVGGNNDFASIWSIDMLEDGVDMLLHRPAVGSEDSIDIVVCASPRLAEDWSVLTNLFFFRIV